MRRRWFKNSRTALLVGMVGLVVGWKALYDAYEGRGRKEPLWVRPMKPF